jgi:hypothetical protein
MSEFALILGGGRSRWLQLRPDFGDREGITELGGAVCESWLVQRFAGGMSQPLDFVLNHQFPALQFDNSQVVR